MDGARQACSYPHSSSQLTLPAILCGSSRNGPPAIVLRAPKVQAQKRLHGKPASSFFVRAHIGGATLVPNEGAVLEEPRPSPTVPLLTSAVVVPPPPTTEKQAVAGSKATLVECTSAAATIAARPHTTPIVPGNGIATSVASALSSMSLASNVSICACAHESTSITSDGKDTAGTSVLETTVEEASSSRNNEEGAVLDGVPTRSKPGNFVRHATLSRGTFGRVGTKGVGRKEAKGVDGSSTSRVPALHGELMLLDGCLHDHKVRTWVETTLVPAKKSAA